MYSALPSGSDFAVRGFDGIDAEHSDYREIDSSKNAGRYS